MMLTRMIPSFLHSVLRNYTLHHCTQLSSTDVSPALKVRGHSKHLWCAGGIIITQLWNKEYGLLGVCERSYSQRSYTCARGRAWEQGYQWDYWWFSQKHAMCTNVQWLSTYFNASWSCNYSMDIVRSAIYCCTPVYNYCKCLEWKPGHLFPSWLMRKDRKLPDDQKNSLNCTLTHIHMHIDGNLNYKINK